VKIPQHDPHDPLDQSAMAPEYRELHRIYVRMAEIREYLIENGHVALQGPCTVDVFALLTQLQELAGDSIVYLQQTVQSRNPALLDVWRKASPE